MRTIKLFNLLFVALTLTMTSCKDDNEDETATIDYTGIYFMDIYNEDIETLPIAGGETTVLKSSVYGAGIAYDKSSEKIYYSDFADSDTPDGKIWKADIDGENATAIVTGLLDPYGIAIDTENEKIYWGDDNGNVSRSNLDGTSKEDIVTIDGGGIRAVAIDATNKKLYFYDVQNNNLYRSNLDGSSKSVIISGYYGYAIAVDEINNKIYFDAQTDNESVSALYRANLDGSNPTLISDTQSRIYGIAIDVYKKKVYWSERDNYNIIQANLNGTQKVILNSVELGAPRGIFLKY